MAGLMLASSVAYADGMLTAKNGMTLYTFDKDAGGTSACTDQCATYWPPYMAEASDKADGEWSMIKRADGKMQWAYNGKPVYFYKDDAAKGDMKGDNFKSMWHIVKE